MSSSVNAHVTIKQEIESNASNGRNDLMDSFLYHFSVTCLFTFATLWYVRARFHPRERPQGAIRLLDCRSLLRRYYLFHTHRHTLTCKKRMD